MIRIDDKEYNAHGYVTTDGKMCVEFESDESLDNINNTFSNAECIEVFEAYEVKGVDGTSAKNTEPRSISITLSVAPVIADTEPMPISEETIPDSAEAYADKVRSGEMKLENVPLEYRDKVAIILGV